MNVRIASRTFGIPPSSICDQLYGKVQEKKREAKTVFKNYKEKNLLKYLFKMKDLGHLLIQGQLRFKMAQATQTRKTP